MGGRGAISSNGGLYNRTPAQDRTLKRIAKRTANLKKEQMRIVDADGNVVLEKQGLAHEVAATVGEKRQYLNGNISIHNHPNGGTFSEADLRDFGYGAKEIVAAAPEGTYRLIRTTKTTPDWVGMQEKLQATVPEVSAIDLRRQAYANTANSKTAKAMQAITKKYTDIRNSKGKEAAGEYAISTKDRYDSLEKQRQAEARKEERRLETKPYDDFYKANAKQYGFIYKFEPTGK